MAGGSLMIGNFNAGSFVVNLGTSYLLGRLTAQDGPRLDNLNATGGDYGVPIPWVAGEAFRLSGIIGGQSDIQEHEHTVEDYSEIVGALTGAAQGFMLGGPIGAVIGAVAGGLLGFLTPDQKYYTYTQTRFFVLCDRRDQDPIEGVLKIIANGAVIFAGGAAVVGEGYDSEGRLIWRKWGKNRYMKSTTLYCGSLEQPADPILAALGDVSAHRPDAYVVMEDLLLDTFDRQFPPVESIAQIKSGETWAETAETIVARAGVDYLRDISTTALTDRLNKGFGVTAESTCFDAIKPWLPFIKSDLGEVAGQMRFYDRAQTMRSTLTLEDMGAHIYGDSPPEKFMFKRDTDLDLPQELALTFIDPERDYQPNTQTAKRSEGNAESNIATSVQVVMYAGEGATTAAVMLWDAWLGRTQGNFTLTDAWSGMSVGLAYGIPVADQVVPYRITRKTRGANGIVEVECLSDETVTYAADVEGTSGTALPDDESELFPDTRLILMDMPILQDEHDDYGFYIVQSGTERYWTRGRIEASSDGTNFATIIDQPYTGVVGDVTGTLAAGTTDGLDDTLDTTTVLTVVLEHDGMILSSTTDAELDVWANFAFVGKDGLGEYLQFKTATKVGFATWELTNLRRGRRGTDWAIATHTSGEEFALLGGANVIRLPYSAPIDWGNLKYFRGVTLHQDADDAEVEEFTNTGEGKRPFSPVNVEGSWDGSNNVTITWDSRSRLFAGGLGEDDNAEWDVEITSGAGRSVTVTAETWTYTAVDQTADGITPGDSISGRVRQTSDVNDGRWRDFTIVGPNASTFDSSLLTFDDSSVTWDAG